MKRYISIIESEESNEKFEKYVSLANQQRGEPEHAMVKYQMYSGGGVIDYCIEHLGDVINRAFKDIIYSVSFGQDTCYDKIHKVLKTVDSRYGFVREANENIKDTAEYRGVTEEEFRNNLHVLIRKYIDEHKKLPNYNPLQEKIEKAVITLGELADHIILGKIRYGETLKYELKFQLDTLLVIAGNNSVWRDEVSK